ncbi:hypothetical protein BCV69DRAFT_281725 [Microstroma glucosiphilum]|uniref:SCP domain-containing protein n=1 Tax=Pseudomicrostroma glucosiphilum TaxID=1684307 RepID=A0A316U9H4_9BASI|nr:hypothetical protein BCV69DRAFT_281725 [Pseudomicrostroma glucosiphilum]PWN21799.1 hypothetical protein BCV69DRAFT_281725 [Pseudomicrostroma glucosiphilum]
MVVLQRYLICLVLLLGFTNANQPVPVPEHYIITKGTTHHQRLQIWRDFLEAHRSLHCSELSPNNLQTVCGGAREVSLEELLLADDLRRERIRLRDASKDLRSGGSTLFFDFHNTCCTSITSSISLLTSHLLSLLTWSRLQMSARLPYFDAR